MIAISPFDQQPRIKIYCEEDSQRCKGDCLLCYNAEESVKLAVDILHEGYIRPKFQISVTRAAFEKYSTPDAASSASSTSGKPSDGNNSKKPSTLSQAQVKVARNAAKQALAWNEDDDSGLANKATALRIIVLEGLFKLQEMKSNLSLAEELEKDIASECSKFGEIEKITLFSKNPRGIVVIKFATSFAAQECIRVMNGRYFDQKKIRSYFWDGVTNYSIVPIGLEEEEEEEKLEKARLDTFGDWLDNEQDELPAEFQLRTE